MWLADAHRQLEEAGVAAYRWPASLTGQKGLAAQRRPSDQLRRTARDSGCARPRAAGTPSLGFGGGWAC